MASKYLKNEKGIVRAITTDNLQLEKPLLNENYDIEVHNRNMDKIDNAIQEVKGRVDGLELTAERVSIADEEGLFEATNVEDALLENKTSIQSANSNISALQSSVNTNKTNIANNTNLANQALNKANEAFQRGDNVKTQLVDKLISEGLDVSTNNTFEELIENIALGKKWASGTTSIAKTSSFNISCSLDFEPSKIFVILENGHRQDWGISKNLIISNIAEVIVQDTNGGNNGLGSTVSFSNNTIKVVGRNINSGTAYYVAGNVTWYAFE